MIFETDLITIASSSCLFVFFGFTKRTIFFSLDRYVSVRPPTAVLARECFCPSQAENWPPSGAVQNTRGDASFPFLLFGGPHAPRGIIIITGSPIKLWGSSSAGEPPRCLHIRARCERVYVHRHTGVETRGRASRELVLLDDDQRPRLVTMPHERSCARPDKPLLKRNSHGSPLYTVDNAIRPSRSKK